MRQCAFTIGMISLVTISLSLLLPARAADREMICSGVLTDMRTIGVQLGNCDLNSVSEIDFKRVTDVCGTPGGIEDDGAPGCRIRAIVAPHVPNRYGTGFINKVRRVLSVSK